MPKRTDPRVTARLDPDLMAWVDDMAEILNLSRAEFVRAMLKELSELPADDPAKAYNAAQGVLLDRMSRDPERESLSA